MFLFRILEPCANSVSMLSFLCACWNSVGNHDFVDCCLYFFVGCGVRGIFGRDLLWVFRLPGQVRGGSGACAHVCVAQHCCVFMIVFCHGFIIDFVYVVLLVRVYHSCCSVLYPFGVTLNNAAALLCFLRS